MSKKLTNRGSHGDTWDAWRFYRRVRPQFLEWNRVTLTFATEPDRMRGTKLTNEAKILLFIDDAGDILELEGVNFGYEGGTPREVVEVLTSEGFSRDIEPIVYNASGSEVYPQTILRDS